MRLFFCLFCGMIRIRFTSQDDVMSKKFVGFILLFSGLSTLHAAKQEMVWGGLDALPQFQQNQPLSSKNHFKKSIPSLSQNAYELRLVKKLEQSDKQHARYQVYFKGLPVWGHQIIVHRSQQQEQVTGTGVSGIENDIQSLDAKLSKEAVEAKILASEKAEVKFKAIKKLIVIDAHNKARLAYHFSYYTNADTEKNKAPNYLIDANTGEVLKHWNAMRSERIGQGLGGNALPLPYRSGMFQHGDALPGLPSLGKFDVQQVDGHCFVENDNIKVFDLENKSLSYDDFPITVFDEDRLQLSPFNYDCDETSFYLNYSDGRSGPMNYSFSPVNDSMYFATEAIEMYQNVYGIKKPIGDDIPLRVYTHLGYMDNAFAIPAFYDENGVQLSHQQVFIGNGARFLTAPAQAVLAHELSHLFTEINGGLIYMGQPGGINESFSDMAAIALQDYIRQKHAWYWDGEDWSIGREAMLSGEPIRYMDDPTKDGMSIDNAADYNDDLDVHETSGVFNKAFYLLANKPNWSIQKAFQVMADANQNYWSPIAYYDFAACGVIQAAVDRHFDINEVKEAFAEVGVNCPVAPF
jgi:pseudolysin